MLKNLLWCSLAVMVALVGFGPLASGQEKEDGFRKMVEARAAQAAKDKNVDGLVQSAYALFPFEVGAKVKEARYLKLLGQASDLVLTKGDAKEAQRFLEMAGALSEALPQDKKDQLTKLAAGKTPSMVVKEEISRAVPKIKERGQDLVDPEIKTRGPADEAMAESLGKAIMATVRPSTLGSGGSRLLSHSVSYPSANRVAVTMRMGWKGLWTDNPYTSDITINFMGAGGKIEILNVDYFDNCLFPAPDMRLISAFIRNFNARLQN